jgi:hypothetical protein
MAGLFNQLFVLLQILVVIEVVVVRTLAIQSFGSLVQKLFVDVERHSVPFAVADGQRLRRQVDQS